MSAIERDPKKRRVKPVESSILDFDLGESSDDSDFRIEDHPDVSDDDSMDSNGNDGAREMGTSTDDDDDDEEDDEDEDDEESDDYEYGKRLQVTTNTNGLSVADVITKAAHHQSNFRENGADISICCGCLGDQSDGINEIAECDSCGVTVHEACYGISDAVSLVSTDSVSPTTPWFCDACKAGMMDPICELCPNKGGIFKETDVGKWVHLVCALYVPGVAFGEVDKLSSVTLFEMQYNKWGAKTCSLCVDARFARTGVCIGCDAGLCRTYFHVTCAQREGFLSEAHSEEVDQADPFYAHCKLHSDKTLVKKRRRNYLALQLRTRFRKLQFEAAGHSTSMEQVRIQRKLAKKKVNYSNLKLIRQPPWVPTQKMPRLITTSASAVAKLMRKTELMGVDTTVLAMQEHHKTQLVDIRKKWFLPPAFSVEFVAYFLDRNERLVLMKDSLEELIADNINLSEEQQTLRTRYDQLLNESAEELRQNGMLKQTIQKYHSTILSSCPNKNIQSIENLGKPPVPRLPQLSMMVPTAAALKMGVGFPLNNIAANRIECGKVLSSHAAKHETIQLNECGICHQMRDQHMLAKCDTCHLYYHLNCLNPPLSRLPKKSKLYGWQCSECDKSSDSEVEHIKEPRRSRGRRNSFNHRDEIFTPIVKIKPVEPQEALVPCSLPAGTVCERIEIIQSPSRVSQKPKTVETIDLTETKTPVTLTMKKITKMSANLSFLSSFNTINSTSDAVSTTNEVQPYFISKSSKKRRREKHRNRYSPELSGFGKEHKRKRKKKSLDTENPNPHPRITIKIKPIPLPAGSVASTSNPQCFYVNNSSNDAPPFYSIIPPMVPIIPHPVPVSVPAPRHVPLPIAMMGNKTVVNCVVCNATGTNADVVKCDDCLKHFHFQCLEPPLKKSPKRRGYSWHCADCDPTGSE